MRQAHVGDGVIGRPKSEGRRSKEIPSPNYCSFCAQLVEAGNLRHLMKIRVIASALLPILLNRFAAASEARIVFAREKKLNNLVSELLEISSVRKSSKPFTFHRESAGWILISSSSSGKGTFRVILDNASRPDAVIVHGAGDPKLAEAVRYLTKGEHQIQVECQGG